MSSQSDLDSEEPTSMLMPLAPATTVASVLSWRAASAAAAATALSATASSACTGAGGVPGPRAASSASGARASLSCDMIASTVALNAARSSSPKSDTLNGSERKKSVVSFTPPRDSSSDAAILGQKPYGRASAPPEPPSTAATCAR
eukprot:364913-Chlamydomonas_euryale.AAC.7